MSNSLRTEVGLTNSEDRQALLENLVLHGLELRRQPFELHSGGNTQIYFNAKSAMKRGETLGKVGGALNAILEHQGIEWQAIGGPGLGGEMVAVSVVATSQENRSWFAIDEKEEIQGAELDYGTRIVISDDTSTTGSSYFEALKVLDRVGCHVVAAVGVLDRSNGQTEQRLSEWGIPFYTLYTLEEAGAAYHRVVEKIFQAELSNS